MPYSSPEGKHWTLERIRKNGASSFLDVGAGAGTYEFVFRPRLGRPSTWVALEVWEPYVAQFALADRYDEVIVEDARTYLPKALTKSVDVVLFGDVLEHVTKEEAVVLWRDAQRIARVAVYVSIPTVHYPQGPEHGNPHEAHVKDDWTAGEVLASFTGIVSYAVGDTVSVFEAPTPDGSGP
jgi:SAM-dependent methyltransferase